MKNYYWDEKNDKFVSAYEEVTPSTRYKPVKIGDPLMIRYLRFNICDERLALEKTNEVMITTQIKNQATKLSAPQMVNYFENVPTYGENKLNISDLGGDTYGHHLIYYDHAYRGQEIKFTVAGLELDSSNMKHVETLKQTVSAFAKLPGVSTLRLPEDVIKRTMDLASQVYKFVNRDDVILPAHSVDLYFNSLDQQHLRSGRYLLIQNDCVTEVLDGKNKYSLNDENILMNNGKAVEDCSYVILQVNNEVHDEYKDFDLYQSAAQYLDLINPGIEVDAFADNLTKMVTDYRDVDMMMRTKKLINQNKDFSKRSSDDLAMIGAYLSNMSDEMKSVHQDVIDDLKKYEVIVR